MKITELWLREWVDPNVSRQAMCEQLTMAGLEVEGCHAVAGNFNQVVVGRIQTAVPHKNADRLQVCEVQISATDTRNIVCGASNARPGISVVVALPGAALPNGMVIKETKLRGELSQGMLCSAAELGLEESSVGILELPNDAPLGVDIIEYLSLNDYVIELGITPNRSDCLSLIGIAREVAVYNHLPLPAPVSNLVPPVIDEKPLVTIQDDKACPYYCARIIRNIRLDISTPIWMKERLRRVGIRTVHPVVDITNYVMIELGQPMHAFNLHAIEGSIQVRWSNPEETLQLLNGQEIKLSNKTLLIADDVKALGLAGVMGGESSMVNETTVDILLESAHFDPVSVAGVARRHGLKSESALRFERGVDPMLPRIAIERATALLLDIVSGQAGLVVEKGFTPQAFVRCIHFNPHKVEALTGVRLPMTQVQSMLSALGFGVSVHEEPWLVHVPSYRFDIALDVDLIEEIIRLYGYHHITPAPYTTLLQKGKPNNKEQLLMKSAVFLCSIGYHETISYAFVDPKLQHLIYPNVKALSLLNPISSELSDMRISLWPGLLASMVHNMYRQQQTIRIFEQGVVFAQNEQGVSERLSLAGLLAGETGALSWNESTRVYDFYDMVGDLQSLSHACKQVPFVFKKMHHDALHPGKSAQLLIHNEPVGWIGVLHPTIAANLDINTEVMLFEINVDQWKFPQKFMYQTISKYPLIRRDLSMLVDAHIEASQIEQVVRHASTGGILKTFDVFDVYTGQGIACGKKSIAIALTLQAENRTLMDQEVNAFMNAIVDALNKELEIQIRE